MTLRVIKGAKPVTWMTEKEFVKNIFYLDNKRRNSINKPQERWTSCPEYTSDVCVNRGQLLQREKVTLLI